MKETHKRSIELPIKIIGVSGYARCGKDTFVGIAKNILRANGYVPFRIAFADKLKEEVTDMLKKHNFSASVYENDNEKKKLIRPLLVWWGCQRRYESDGGLYWVNTADEIIFQDRTSNHHGMIPEDKLIFLVSDVRFPNEAKWLHEKWSGVLVHLKKWETHEVKCGQDIRDMGFAKVYDEAPNEEEAKQDPLVQELADHKIEWESKKKMTTEEAIEDPYLQKIVLDTLNSTKYFKHPTSGILSL